MTTVTAPPMSATLSCTDVLKYVRPTILVTDRLGNILQAHGGSGRPLGYEPNELVGQHGIAFVAPEDHQIMADTYLATGDLPIVTSPEPFPIRMIGPDGEARIWDCVPGGFTEGEQEGWVLTLTCRNELTASIDAMDCFIAGGSPLDIARVVAERYQANPHEEWRKCALAIYRHVLEDGTLGEWMLLDPPAGTPHGIAQAAIDCLEAEDAPWNVLCSNSMTSDTHLPAPLSEAAHREGLPYATALTVGIGQDARVVFIRMSNFSRELQVNTKLSDKAVNATLRKALIAEQSRALLDKTMRSDSLTGVANRLHFDEVVAENIDAEESAVLYIDVDKFKAANDTYGHEVGDDVLRVIATRIVRACRPDDFVARIGGDEFAVILRGVTPEDADGVSTRIAASMKQPLNLDVGPKLIDVTIGIATSEGDQTLADLVRESDHAMLARKPTGPRSTPAVEDRREPYAQISDRRVKR